MNCADIRNGRAGADEPGLREHLAGCAACREALARGAAAARLMALKRYEQPDPGFEARCLDGVRRRIRARAAAPPPVWARLRERLELEPVPIYRLAAAAAAVLLVVGYALLPRPAPRVQAPALGQVAPALETMRLAADATNPIVVMTPTGAVPPRAGQPGGVQYGPGGTTPVNYNY